MTNHVYPLGDIIQHDTETDNCVCQPKIEFINGEKLVIHNSFDEREIFEDIQEVQ